MMIKEVAKGLSVHKLLDDQRIIST